jgi:hypothetical protein
MFEIVRESYPGAARMRNGLPKPAAYGFPIVQGCAFAQSGGVRSAEWGAGGAVVL